MNNNIKPGRINNRRVATIVAPFILLSLCLVAINLISLRRGEPGISDSTMEPTPIVVPSPMETAPLAAATATPTMIPQTPSPTRPSDPSPTPTASPLPLPTYPPGTEVRLLGPPPESIFSIQDEVVFFWTWPVPLKNGEKFAFYLLLEEQEILLGEISEPNLGNAYRVSVVLDDHLDASTTSFWQVRLLSERSQSPLIVSNVRRIQVIPGN